MLWIDQANNLYEYMKRFCLSFPKLIGFSSIFCAVVVFSSLWITGCTKNNSLPDPQGNEETGENTSQRFDGTTIRILTFDGPIGKTTARHAQDFEAMTGVKIQLQTVPFGEVYQSILQDLASNTPQYDAVFFVSQWLADYAEPGYLEDLTDRVKADTALEWKDIAPFYRNFAATYRSRVYGIPVDGDYHMVYYRTDLLNQAGLEAPKTWDDYLAIAEQFHGQDFTGDGKPDYGSCIAKQPNHAGHWMFGSIAAAYLQSQGTQQGAFFDPDTMQPLVKNAAFAEALDIYKATSQYGPPDELTYKVDQIMDMEVLQHCALTLFWGDIAPLAVSSETQLKDNIGSTILPGTTEVLDRETGELVPCDKFTCPFAIDGVNHAPYAANIGWSGGINTAATPEAKAASYAFISYISQPQHSNIDVAQGGSGFNPYRISQFSDRQVWLQSGMSAEVASKYLGAIGASLNSSNMVLDLTIPQAGRYQQDVLDDALTAFLKGEIDRDAAMEKIETGWNALTEEIGRDRQLEAYRNSLEL